MFLGVRYKVHAPILHKIWGNTVESAQLACFRDGCGSILYTNSKLEIISVFSRVVGIKQTGYEHTMNNYGKFVIDKL